jgi:SAM-dependent methyltransferase
VKSKAQLGAEQAAFWNGPGGQMWLTAYERTRQAVAPFGEAVLAAAAPQLGGHVLDVGCGTGETTAALAKSVGPQGRVLGIDVSEPLIATARAQTIANATFAVGDAATHRFEGKFFDLLFSRFGVMFFGDPVAAFTNLHHALKPDGRLVFVCWRPLKENPWSLLPFQAGAPYLPSMERPGPEDPGQFSFGERARVEHVLGQSGFGAPSFLPLDHPIRLGQTAAEAVENVAHRGPLGRLMAQATAEQADKAKKAILAVLARHEGAAGVALPGACWLVSAAQA